MPTTGCTPGVPPGPLLLLASDTEGNEEMPRRHLAGRGDSTVVGTPSVRHGAEPVGAATGAAARYSPAASPGASARPSSGV